jgi:hypothetical protein
VAYLSFAICPEVHAQGDHVVDRGVGALVQQCGGQSRQREEDQASLNAAVERRAGYVLQRPLPGEHDQAKDDVDDLEGGEWLDSAIEGLGEEVFDSCTDLVYRASVGSCRERRGRTHRWRRRG